MLRYFFEKTEISTAYLFEKSNIWQEVGFSELQGTFPVVFLSFKDVKSDAWSGAYAELQSLIKSEVDRTLTPIFNLLNDQEKFEYKALVDLNLEEDKLRVALTDSLKFITKVLSRIHKKNAIVLIDEYDTPITHAYANGFYEKMISFMRSFLSKGLKGNSSLHRALMTGVVRTAKDGIVSGLNNPRVCTMLDSSFADKFGFTETEVDQLLHIAGRSKQKNMVKSWYNGYVVGSKCLSDPDTVHLVCYVYNPWSILSYLGGPAKRPEIYWANTGSTDLLEGLISEANEETQKELKLLIEGKSLKIN